MNYKREIGNLVTEVDDAALQLRDRSSDRFELIRSVSFARVGNR